MRGPTCICWASLTLFSLQRCTNDSAVDASWDSADTDYDEAKASRRSDYYFAFFLCYPSMTQSFFNHFNCRRLSPTLWVLQKDYSEQCFEGWWWIFALFSALGLAVILGLGRIVALHYRLSTSYHIR